VAEFPELHRENFVYFISLVALCEKKLKQALHNMPNNSPLGVGGKKQTNMSTYKIDASHSEITFKVKHLMITNVTGSFQKFDATLEAAEADFSDAKISFSADVNSISTNNEQRDGHLKSDDFFAAEKFPALSFTSTSFTKKSEDEYSLVGDLTIRDVTKQVELAVEYGGTMTDFYGQEKAGFEISGKINRKEFGLGWGAVTEAGGIVVSDEVKLHLAVQMVKQA
jgi:polyisoprenoid-binding protein YceI